MFFSQLAMPMRAQPFHFGHMHLLRTMSTYCNKGIIVLCRDYDNENNPFSLDMRTKWISNFLIDQKIDNLTVAQRRTDIHLPRYIEYPHLFQCRKLNDIVVLTTNETDSIYRTEGFRTCNHHAPEFIKAVWKQNQIDGPIILEGTGTIIRKRLRENLSCADYLLPEIEISAKNIILKRDDF